MYITDSKGSLVNLVAGLFVLISVVLGFTAHHYFFIFAGWVGFMLATASITGFCPMFFLLRKMGLRDVR